MKIIYAGTPNFAATILDALVNSKHQICAVYTQPDRAAGRGKKLRQSAVKQYAIKQQLPIEQPINLTDENSLNRIKSFAPDLIVVVAYGVILPAELLKIPTHGCINVHASLLPRWRGAAPIQRAILANDCNSGITIMQMDAGLDTGDILNQQETPIYNTDTSSSLLDRLADLGTQALLTTLTQIEQNSLSITPQDPEQATYAKKISKQEAAIQWSNEADFIARQIRAFNPFPIAFTSTQGQRVKIWEAKVEEINSEQAPGTILSTDSYGILVATGQQSLAITKLQLPGGRPLLVRDVLNARQHWFQPGFQFQATLPENN